MYQSPTGILDLARFLEGMPKLKCLNFECNSCVLVVYPGKAIHALCRFIVQEGRMPWDIDEIAQMKRQANTPKMAWHCDNLCKSSQRNSSVEGTPIVIVSLFGKRELLFREASDAEIYNTLGKKFQMVEGTVVLLDPRDEMRDTMGHYFQHAVLDGAADNEMSAALIFRLVKETRPISITTNYHVQTQLEKEHTMGLSFYREIEETRAQYNLLQGPIVERWVTPIVRKTLDKMYMTIWD